MGFRIENNKIIFPSPRILLLTHFSLHPKKEFPNFAGL